MKCSHYRFVVLLVLLTPIRAQTLDDYLQEAMENNPSLQAVRASLAAAKQRVRQAGTFADPVFSMGYFISPVETRVGPQQLRMGFLQQLPWWGNLAAERTVSRLRARAQHKEFIAARAQLIHQVKAAWYALYENKKLLAAQEQHMALLASLQAHQRARLTGGQVALADRLQTDVMMDIATTDIAILQEEEKILRLRFNTLLHRRDDTPVVLNDSLRTEDMVPPRQSSPTVRHPTLTALDFDIQAAVAQKRLAQWQRLPQVGIGLDYVLVGEHRAEVPNSGQDIVAPVLRMNIPIFGAKYQAAIREANYQQQALVAAKEAANNAFVLSYKTAWYETDKAYRLSALYTEQLKKTTQIIQLMLAAYRNGEETIERLLSVQQQHLSYERKLHRAAKDYYVALSELNYLTNTNDEEYKQ